MSRNRAESSETQDQTPLLNPKNRELSFEKPVRNSTHVKMSRRQLKRQRAEHLKSLSKPHQPISSKRTNPDHPAPPNAQQAQQSPESEPPRTDMPRSKRRRMAKPKAQRQSMPSADPLPAVPNSDIVVQPDSLEQHLGGKKDSTISGLGRVSNGEAGDTKPAHIQQSSTSKAAQSKKRKRDRNDHAGKTDWSAVLKNRSAVGHDRKNFAQLLAANSGDVSGAGEGADNDRKDHPVPSDANANEESPKNDDQDDRLHRTVFVGNVPLKACQKDIKKLFQPFGRIESVRIRGVTPVNPRLPKRMAFVTRNFAQFADSHQAYVVFAEEEGFEKAMDNAIDQLNMTIYMGQHLRVKHADTSKPTGWNVSVFVGNLPFDCREEELINTFQSIAEQVGAKITDVRVNRDKDTGVGRGIGFVSFNDRLAVQACVNVAENLRIRDRIVRVELADKGKKASTHTSKRMKRGKSRKGNMRGPSPYESHQHPKAR
eukprot:GFKZ01014925.1.p1 GENE.GFKZ01014925.1~~GFKZ01014925.1.p1  ORF type:complete len:484 (-),score=64.64 GFKZ01014925.1:165-1616(-)